MCLPPKVGVATRRVSRRGSRRTGCAAGAARCRPTGRAAAPRRAGSRSRPAWASRAAARRRRPRRPCRHRFPRRRFPFRRYRLLLQLRHPHRRLHQHPRQHLQPRSARRIIRVGRDQRANGVEHGFVPWMGVLSADVADVADGAFNSSRLGQRHVGGTSRAAVRALNCQPPACNSQTLPARPRRPRPSGGCERSGRAAVQRRLRRVRSDARARGRWRGGRAMCLNQPAA